MLLLGRDTGGRGGTGVLVGRTTLGGTGLEGGLTWQRWNC